jgi:hypothetical protein
MKRVLERDGWRCQKCGSLEGLQVHHKIKRSDQGDDALANLLTLCAPVPPGGARAAFLSGASGQSLQQAQATKKVMT